MIECHITARAHFVNARDKRRIDLTSDALPFGDACDMRTREMV